MVLTVTGLFQSAPSSPVRLHCLSQEVRTTHTSHPVHPFCKAAFVLVAFGVQVLTCPVTLGKAFSLSDLGRRTHRYQSLRSTWCPGSLKSLTVLKCFDSLSFIYCHLCKAVVLCGRWCWLLHPPNGNACRQFWLLLERSGCSWDLVVEVRDAAQHSPMCKAAPHNQELSAPKCLFYLRNPALKASQQFWEWLALPVTS